LLVSSINDEFGIAIDKFNNKWNYVNYKIVMFTFLMKYIFLLQIAQILKFVHQILIQIV